MRKSNVNSADDFFTWCEKLLSLPHGKYHTDENGGRKGQVFFNALGELKPHLADRVRFTPVDPFYSDALIPAFMNWVRDNWNK